METQIQHSSAISAQHWTPPQGFTERHIKIREAASIAGLGVSTIYKLIANGRFPKPIDTGGLRVTLFRLSDVLAWLEHRQRLDFLNLSANYEGKNGNE